MNPLLISYRELRFAVGALGLLLVPILILKAGVLTSISAYYFSPARDTFVAVLATIGTFLIAYRGYDQRDLIAGRVAGVSAIGVGMLPHTGDTSTPHAVCALMFFLAAAYFCLALFTQSAGAMTSRKKARNRIYVACGIVILACVGHVAAGALFGAPADSILWPETLAVMAFGISWTVKAEVVLADLGAG